MVLKVALDCSDPMSLRATSTVLSMAMAYYRKNPITCWINFILSSGRSGVSSSGSANYTLAPYVGATRWCGDNCLLFFS